ncbi:Chitinase 1 [Tulasnella sp. 330]|nr:Chitinase 1 [Tulasnella sp. 330]KAG8890063.1 Chitinase 1 [Tulasnella sp. 332]
MISPLTLYAWITWILLLIKSVQAYDATCNDNLVQYWGQNSYGAANPSGSDANQQQRLSYYCDDDTTDGRSRLYVESVLLPILRFPSSSVQAFPIAFLNVFFGVGNAPELNLANTCSTVNDTVFPGTELVDCSFLAADIKTCQAAGKIVTLSIGGATGGGMFSGDSEATGFADQIWDMFLGGSSSMRPFGTAVLDGVDLDIEGGTESFVPFVNQLRSHMKGASKTYYITAAPQCVYPDASIGATLNAVGFDAIYVQLYNNPCGLTHYNDGTYTWNFAVWDYWATNISPNKNVKVFIGAPASSTAAGSGYVDSGTLQTIAQATRKDFPSFGGVMFWDASQSYANGRFDQATKAFLKSGGSCGQAFTYQPCTAQAFDSTANYPMGSTVSYGGYQWIARYYASGAPDGSTDGGSWRALFACSGSAPLNATSTATMVTSTASTETDTETETATETETETTETATSTASVTISTAATTSFTATGATTGTLRGTLTITDTITATRSTITVSTASSSAASTASSGSGTCNGVAAWADSTPYASPNQCTYNGQLWQANQWNYNEVPGGVSGAWTLVGVCSSLSDNNKLAQKAFAAGSCTIRRAESDSSSLQPTNHKRRRWSLPFMRR